MKLIDARLARLVVPYDEWEVLYRQRLQIERDLLRADAPSPEDTDGGSGHEGLVDRLGRAVEVLVGR